LNTYEKAHQSQLQYYFARPRLCFRHALILLRNFQQVIWRVSIVSESSVLVIVGEQQIRNAISKAVGNGILQR
jgi:hypothetical protein